MLLKGGQKDDSNADKEYSHAYISDAEHNEVDESSPTSIINNQGTYLSEGTHEKSMSTPVTDEVRASFTSPVFWSERSVRVRGFFGDGTLFIVLMFLTCIGHTTHRDLAHIPWDRGKFRPGGLKYRMGGCVTDFVPHMLCC